MFASSNCKTAPLLGQFGYFTTSKKSELSKQLEQAKPGKGVRATQHGNQARSQCSLELFVLIIEGYSDRRVIGLDCKNNEEPAPSQRVSDLQKIVLFHRYREQ